MGKKKNRKNDDEYDLFADKPPVPPSDDQPADEGDEDAAGSAPALSKSALKKAKRDAKKAKKGGAAPIDDDVQEAMPQVRCAAPVDHLSSNPSLRVGSEAMAGRIGTTTTTL